MKLQLVDVLIIAAYLVIMIVIGLLLKKKAFPKISILTFERGKHSSVLYVRSLQCFRYV